MEVKLRRLRPGSLAHGMSLPDDTDQLYAHLRIRMLNTGKMIGCSPAANSNVLADSVARGARALVSSIRRPLPGEATTRSITRATSHILPKREG